MGNILAGFVTGVFIYITDMILQQFVVGSGFMEIIKFTVQGILTYVFVETLQKISPPSKKNSN